MFIVHNQGTPNSLWVTVVTPPKTSSRPVRAFIDGIKAAAYAQEFPEGARRVTTRVEGDIPEALWPSHGWKETNNGT